MLKSIHCSGFITQNVHPAQCVGFCNKRVYFVFLYNKKAVLTASTAFLCVDSGNYFLSTISKGIRTEMPSFIISVMLG